MKRKILRTTQSVNTENWVYQNCGIDSFVHSSFHDNIAAIISFLAQQAECFITVIRSVKLGSVISSTQHSLVVPPMTRL
jgi:hypothetical protein